MRSHSKLSAQFSNLGVAELCAPTGQDSFMKLPIPLLLASLLTMLIGFASPLHAASIELNDGTVINGEIVRFQSGSYQVKSASLGTLNIDEYDIASIDYSGGKKRRSNTTAQSSGTQPAGNEIQRLQVTLASDAGLMESISGLQSDPQVQAILNDPQIMQAIMSYDLEALTSNEKFMALMNNANVQAVSKQALGK